MRIAILAYTEIASDHRVRRTADALFAAGHDVTVIGFGQAPADAGWRFEGLPASKSRHHQRLGILLTQAPANFLPPVAPYLHGFLGHHRVAREKLIALRPDIIHANDWNSLPAATAAKRATGARLVYDSHELAVEEHADNLRWRLVAQRSTMATERHFIHDADAVITVSDGISHALASRYDLNVVPTVLRNTPRYQYVSPVPLSSPKRLLFHGVLKQGRGIEATIGAMAFLPDCYLTIRGNGPSDYLAALRSQASGLGVSARIGFEAAVAGHDVITKASSCHIGIFCAPMDTQHNRFAMPNKFFRVCDGRACDCCLSGIGPR